ncbi:short-chain dehydrogenase/reductase [Secundilactobacillus paracollinoides]|uniref:Short-chain dehydrogenase/reductase n=1 Tax=Secundilactobacillus paracollinoides TaxID=240427 RepID=A0A1B2IW16_9LACO|nr:SDR family NAD(P)-dependent oxidoreductase [Secundilactobacillus paracollinoides]ANZ60392.1 short-chain dehydrogenase/reductase [Secundilactobacillus paracollinoides]ANZ65327.1 short-chain dehydrogenase/reductase [Secundilactobacillus paracollinoides]ANZ66221.1 short-chain dehydrogenase/reductase [Secundilactobacillus paracollinoides]KRL75026.1 short-chain dehydrogenase [Secundilactobacillus paracollinoides DSM 15502 = JCM 11969]
MAGKTVFITGASSGMGFAAAKLFAERGWQVYAGARRTEKIPAGNNIHALHLDVTNRESRNAFVDEALEVAGTVDVLINNAGYGEFGPLEEVSEENARKQLETNLLGASELTKLVLPTMRFQRSGRIINISSIGGEMYSPLGGWYYVTKHALNVWSDTLDTEVRQFGIRSIIVEPGGTASSWTEIAMANAEKNLKPDSPYLKLTNGTKALLKRLGGQSSATSEDLAEVFYSAATDVKPKYRYYHSLGDNFVGHFARVHQHLFKHVMNFAVDRLIK